MGFRVSLGFLVGFQASGFQVISVFRALGCWPCCVLGLWLVFVGRPCL